MALTVQGSTYTAGSTSPVRYRRKMGTTPKRHVAAATHGTATDLSVSPFGIASPGLRESSARPRRAGAL